MMTLVLGWIGSICFSACCIPQMLKCMKQGHARGLSPWFLGLWCGGEIFYGTAMYLELGLVAWVLLNYVTNLICILIILRYYFWPTRPILTQLQLTSKPYRQGRYI